MYGTGGGNPGTPAYVGMIGIILRGQKNTSGYNIYDQVLRLDLGSLLGVLPFTISAILALLPM